MASRRSQSTSRTEPGTSGADRLPGSVRGDERVLMLVFDPDGEIERCCADARPRLVHGRSGAEALVAPLAP